LGIRNIDGTPDLAGYKVFTGTNIDEKVLGIFFLNIFLIQFSGDIGETKFRQIIVSSFAG
jgi:hypothetical protein